MPGLFSFNAFHRKFGFRFFLTFFLGHNPSEWFKQLIGSTLKANDNNRYSYRKNSVIQWGVH